jgi:hypothetical protein
MTRYHMQGNLKDWHNGGNSNIQLNSLKNILKASTWYQKLLTVNHLMPNGMYPCFNTQKLCNVPNEGTYTSYNYLNK